MFYIIKIIIFGKLHFIKYVVVCIIGYKFIYFRIVFVLHQEEKKVYNPFNIKPKYKKKEVARF